MVVGGELKRSAADRKREIHCEKLKIHTKFQFENLKGIGTLGYLGLDEMLKTL